MTRGANHIDYAKIRPDLVRLLEARRGGKARGAGYDDIEDLAQDTIARAISREGTIAAFDPNRSTWVGWMLRVADDCMRTAWRRHAVAREGVERLAHDPTARPAGL